jgi:hypothetical protein
MKSTGCGTHTDDLKRDLEKLCVEMVAREEEAAQYSDRVEDIAKWFRQHLSSNLVFRNSRDEIIVGSEAFIDGLGKRRVYRVAEQPIASLPEKQNNCAVVTLLVFTKENGEPRCSRNIRCLKKDHDGNWKVHFLV